MDGSCVFAVHDASNVTMALIANVAHNDNMEETFVSRGGLKLAAALDAFALAVDDLVCVDLGCNVGGFTDCLLQRGAAHVYAVDTGYGTLAWTLRNDERVTVMERSNALHVEPAVTDADLAVIDLGWTRQKHALPAARRWLGSIGQVVTLVKPHYECEEKLPRGAILEDEQSRQICERVLEDIRAMGWEVRGCIESPIRGGSGKGKQGNREYLAWVVMGDDAK